MTTASLNRTLHVLDASGDSRTIWNPENQDEVDAAKATFDRLKGKGYLAYSVDEDGGRGEVMQRFDPHAGRIIMSRPLAGG
jgi:hypothetical protein